MFGEAALSARFGRRCVSLPLGKVLAQPVAVGGEFQVNAYTPSDQWFPSISADADGDFVVTWSSSQDGSDYGIFARRFSSTGAPLASEFQVNPYTTGRQFRPAVAIGSDGYFVVTWDSLRGTASFYDVFAQRFNAAGLRQASEFQVNSYTTNKQYNPSVAMGGAGDFVVAWQSSYQDGDYHYGVFAKRFNAAGAPQASEFQVSTYTTGSQRRPAVAMGSAGDFVVTWSSPQDGSGYGVFGRRFNAAGTPQASEFQVNSYTTDIQSNVRIGLDSEGDFVVSWLSHDQDGSGFGIFAQRFDSGGAPQDAELQVSNYTIGDQIFPAVAVGSDGEFVVTWQSYTRPPGPPPAYGGQDGSSGGVFARRFDSSGVPEGAEFQVNSYTTGSQYGPAVSMDDSGDFVIAWWSDGQDSSSSGVFAQRFSADGAGSPTPTPTPGITVSPTPTPTSTEPTVTPTPGPLRYVALGDSYSSGEGAFHYPYSTDQLCLSPKIKKPTFFNCHRSASAYSKVSIELPDLIADRFIACSGAEIVNVVRSEDGGKGFKCEAPQLDDPLIDESTDLVTITIGGNDAGFATVLKDCGIDTPNYDCRQGLAFLKERINQEIVLRLIALFRSIQDEAPNAKVIVLGYPSPFPRHPDLQSCKAFDPGFPGLLFKWAPTEQVFMNELADLLRSAMARAASAASIGQARKIAFLWPDAFDGHELCGAKKGPRFEAAWEKLGQLGLLFQENYHPTAEGHLLGYRRTLEQFIKQEGLLGQIGMGQASQTDAPTHDELSRRQVALPSIYPTRGDLEIAPADPPLCVAEAFAPGEIVQLGASDYQPSSSVALRLAIHGVELGNAVTDSNGDLDVTLQLPSDLPPGSLELLEANGTGSNGAERLLSVLFELGPPFAIDDDLDGIPDICDVCPESETQLRLTPTVMVAAMRATPVLTIQATISTMTESATTWIPVRSMETTTLIVMDSAQMRTIALPLRIRLKSTATGTWWVMLATNAPERSTLWAAVWPVQPRLSTLMVTSPRRHSATVCWSCAICSASEDWLW